MAEDQEESIKKTSVRDGCEEIFGVASPVLTVDQKESAGKCPVFPAEEIAGPKRSAIPMDAEESAEILPVQTPEEMCGSHSTGVKGSGRLTDH